MATLHVGYILYRFPTLSETFIARELDALQRRGVHLTITSLLPPRRGPTNKVAEQLLAQVGYVPGPLELHFWGALIYYALRQPGVLLRTLMALLSQPYPGTFFQLLVWRTYMFAKGVAAAYMLREVKLDLLHTHFAAWPAAAATVAAALLKLPFSVTAGHGYDLYTSSTLLEYTVDAAAQVVTIAEQRRQDILQRCPQLTGADVPVIPCGIDVAAIPVFTRADTNQIRIISVGRFIEAKGHEYLVQACSELKNRGIEFRCTIVGSGTPEAERALVELIDQLQLQDEISLAGALSFDEILNQFQEHDMYVMPCVVASDNTRDATPVVFVEAAATGLPLISTPIGGVPEIVVDNVTGLLVAQRNAVAVADAIIELASDPLRRRQLGANGRRLVEEKFDSTKNAERLVGLFTRVAARPSAQE
jgi:glycosyltransferase involved in cell wall biosynthesis